MKSAGDLKLVSARGTDAPVEGLRAGDREALESTLRALAPVVRRWVYRTVGPSSPEAPDLVQEALIELAKALPSYRGEASVKTFARKVVARRVCRSFRRRPRVERAGLHLVAEPRDDRDPERRLMADEALERLYRCARRLPAKRRAVYSLCALQGMPPAEAAEALGIRADAARSRLKHARRDMERMLRHDPYLAPLLSGAEGPPR